jgi:hypothetical protein
VPTSRAAPLPSARVVRPSWWTKFRRKTT